MYRIKFKDNLIYMNGDNERVAYDIKLTEEANKAGSLVFSVPANVSIPKLQPFLYVYQDDVMIWRGRVVSSEANFYDEVEYTAEGMLAVLNDTLIEPYVYSGTVEGLFSYILNKHNSKVKIYEINDEPTWEADRWYLLANGEYNLIADETQFDEAVEDGANIFEVTDDSKVINIGNVSEELDPNNYIHREWEKYTPSWELIKTRLLDEIGGYLNLRYVGNDCYLDYLTEEDVKVGSSQYVQLGENLMDLTSFIDATSLYTACVPIGAEIKTRTYNQWDYSQGEPEWQENKWYIGDGEKTLLEGTSGQNTFNQYVNSQANLYQLQSEEATGEYTKITNEEDDLRNPHKYLGQEYLLASQELIDRYGIVYAPIDETTWDDITLPNNLLTKAESYLDNQAVMLSDNIEIELADLSRLGFETDEIHLFNEIRVQSAFHNIDKRYMVLKTEIDLAEPETSTITIGDTTLTLVDKTIQRDRDVTIISGQIEVIRKDKADVERLEREVTVINKTITDTEESLGLQIQAVDSKADSIATRTTNLEATADGINLEISRESTDQGSVGWTTEQINTHFSFSADGMEIGKSGSPTKMQLSNEDLTFEVNGVESATFRPNELDVRNVEVKNEVGFNGKWAIRQNPNGNLDDIWIGGAN